MKKYYCEDCKKETVHVPMSCFAHSFSSEDMDLDDWVCEKCFTELLKKCNKEY